MFKTISKKAEAENNIVKTKILLSDFGLSADDEEIEKICELLLSKENGFNYVLTNPYMLLPFFTYEKLDKIALAKGISANNMNRIRAAGITLIENGLKDNGGTAYSFEDVAKELSLKLGVEVSVSDVEQELNVLHQRGFVFKKDGFISSIKLFGMEQFIYDVVTKNATIQKGDILKDIEKYIVEEENKLGFKYADMQKEIIKLANKRYGVFSLNGFAGAGKTTASLSVLNLYATKYQRDEIVCCALSGVAANRIKIVTGYQSKTIHSLLGYDGKDFKSNEENKLPYSFIVLDEAGMVDSELFYRLLKAIDFTRTTLLIAGDSAQLQSVGRGDVYNNILSSSLCHTITLDKVYRQKETQVINIMAQSIRKAITPDYKGEYEDFEYISAYGDNIVEELIQISGKYKEKLNISILNGDYKGFLSGYQVIVPIKKRNLGVYAINNVLQSVFNPLEDEDFLVIKTDAQYTKIKAKDKVIHMVNQNMKTVSKEIFEKNSDSLENIKEFEETRVFNGQMGIVLFVDMNANNKRGTTYVYYPEEEFVAIYSNNDIVKFRLLDLAYAITVHKSQGSQYDVLTMLMSGQYQMMLNNQLIYTAVTRAKNMLYIIGEENAFKRGSTNKESTKRDTVLKIL